MPKYLEIAFTLPDSEAQKEMLTAMLANIGYDSFMDDEMLFKAYCPEEHFNKSEIKQILTNKDFVAIQLVSIVEMPDENWNANWESAYEDVVVQNRCRIRAPFHKAGTQYEFEIVIAPKMSFGTAHHETTAQMIALMLDMDFKDRKVLDMGSGTAVLAILAKKLGAKEVIAIDNDEWAFNNAIENVELNAVADITVELGDASTIGVRKFDVILANINRNILLEDMPHYVQSLKENGKILFSGFYKSDLTSIRDRAEALGLTFHNSSEKNNWVAVEFNY